MYSLTIDLKKKKSNGEKDSLFVLYYFQQFRKTYFVTQSVKKQGLSAGPSIHTWSVSAHAYTHFFFVKVMKLYTIYVKIVPHNFYVKVLHNILCTFYTICVTHYLCYFYIKIMGCYFYITISLCVSVSVRQNVAHMMWEKTHC